MSKEATTITVLSGFNGESAAVIKVNDLVKSMLPRPQTGSRSYIVVVEILEIS